MRQCPANRQPGEGIACLLLIAGSLLAAILVAWMLIQSPWADFPAQGKWLMQNTWGQIALFDLYGGFMLGLALIWLFEPSLPLRLGMTVLLPLMGNPVLALWLLYRWQKLRRMAQSQDFD